jgi:hypothetical protein
VGVGIEGAGEPTWEPPPQPERKRVIAPASRYKTDNFKIYFSSTAADEFLLFHQNEREVCSRGLDKFVVGLYCRKGPIVGPG